MRVSRRFLRTAVLAMVFALAFAGTALAANRMWTGGGGDKKWSTLANWDSGIPGTGDKAIITAGAEVEVDGPAAAQVVNLAEGAKLTLNNVLELDNGGALEASGSATVTSKAAGGLTFDTTNKVAVSAGKTLTLAAEGAGTIVGAAADLKLSGKGKLTLTAPVTNVTGVAITEGGTLVVNADGVLPSFAGDTVTITEGNLTLNKVLKDNTVKNIVMTKGTLTVAGDGTIGDESTPNGEVDLAAAGRLVLQKDLKLKTLTTDDGSQIDTGDHALTVKPAAGLFLNAAVTGVLSLDISAGFKATLKKDVKGTVRFQAAAGVGSTLALDVDVKVTSVDFTTAAVGDTFKLDLGGKNEIGNLSFAKTTAGLTVKSDGAADTENTIHFLQPAADATLELSGGTRALVVRDGTKGVKWNVKVGNFDTFRVRGKDLLTGEVKVTLARSSILALPSGEFPKLELNATGANDSTIEVDAATQDPVLKLKKIDVAAGKTLKMNRPKTWWKSLAVGDTVVLLKADDVELNGTGKIEGEPKTEAGVADIEWKGGEKALVLTAKGDLKVPELAAKMTASGNKRSVNVTVSGDVKVLAASWGAELLSVLAPDSVKSVTLKAGATDKAATFEVEVGAGFTSGTLRVYAKNQVAPNFEGFVDADLNAVPGGGGGGGGGGTPGTPGTPAASIDPSSWETTSISVPDAQGNVTVQLAATLKLEGTPKSLDVVASGMKEKPKAELLDGSGKVVVSSMPVVKAGAKSYKLRVTCKTTKADIDAGKAAIEKVLVATSDGKVHTITVNKKLKDIGKPGQPGNPGNPGQPGQPDNPGDSKGGGGCDAGVGGLALALVGAFLLRRKA